MQPCGCWIEYVRNASWKTNAIEKGIYDAFLLFIDPSFPANGNDLMEEFLKLVQCGNEDTNTIVVWKRILE